MADISESVGVDLKLQPDEEMGLSSMVASI